MSDESIIALLTEIRDLQRANFENYKVALANQAQSIEIQRQAIARQKFAVISVFVTVGLALIVLITLMSVIQR